jgi:hypothetical protein
VIVNRRQAAMAFATLMLAACAHGASGTPHDQAASEEEGAAHAPPVESFVVFAGTVDTADQDLPPQLGAALAELSGALSGALRRRTRYLILSDAQTGRLDLQTGRALIDRINAQYGLTLDYESGPYLVVLPRDPNEAALAGDQVLVAAFAGQSADAVVRSIEQMSAATRATDTRRLSVSAIIAQFKESWAAHSPVQTHTASATGASSTQRP